MAHALYSPSSADRWFNCPASPSMSADVPYTVSLPAAEGTLLHQISEMQLKDRMENAMLETYWLNRTEVIEDFEIEINQDMIDCAKAYVDYVNDTTERLDGKLLIEEKVSLEEISAKCWGTADALVLGDNKIAVIDFKSGKWPVTAEHNKQLSIYGLGALARYGNEETELELTIVQPRAKDNLGAVRSWTVQAQDLVVWGYGELKTATDACDEENPRFNPGDWCRFCPARDKCDVYKLNQEVK